MRRSLSCMWAERCWQAFVFLVQSIGGRKRVVFPFIVCNIALNIFQVDEHFNVIDQKLAVLRLPNSSGSNLDANQILGRHHITIHGTKKRTYQNYEL